MLQEMRQLIETQQKEINGLKEALAYTLKELATGAPFENDGRKPYLNHGFVANALSRMGKA